MLNLLADGTTTISSESTVTVALLVVILGSVFGIFSWLNAKLSGYITKERSDEILEGQKERHDSLAEAIKNHTDEDREQFRSINEKLDDIRFAQRRKHDEE